MRYIPIFLLVFALWLNYQLRKASRSQKGSDEEFWARDQRANLSRSRDISSLDYINIDLSKLPLDNKEDQTLNSYRDTIIKLADKKVLNLSGKSNTELKEAYGIANLNKLIEYDNNYLALVSILHKWAKRLYDSSYIADARAVLEYALAIKSDVASSYKLLAKIYKEQNMPEKIQDLIHLLSDINIRNKDELIRSINKIMLS